MCQLWRLGIHQKFKIWKYSKKFRRVVYFFVFIAGAVLYLRVVVEYIVRSQLTIVPTIGSEIDSVAGWRKDVSRYPTIVPTNGPEIDSIAGWEKNVSRYPRDYIQPYEDTTILTGEKICSENPQLVIIIGSAPEDFSGRKLIRETWASKGVENAKIGFLVGSNQTIQRFLEGESEKYGDVIEEDFVDTYNNLTLKSILLLKWYMRNCPNSSFLMKSDTDTYVDVQLLVTRLKHYHPEGILMGYLCIDCRVDRELYGRYAVPRYMYDKPTFPNFLYGQGYIMSRDVAGKLFTAALSTPIITLEDVYITGLCALRAGVSPQHFPGCASYVYNVWKICSPDKTMCHPVRREEMTGLWKRRRALSFEQRLRLRRFVKMRRVMNIFHGAAEGRQKLVSNSYLLAENNIFNYPFTVLHNSNKLG